MLGGLVVEPFAVLAQDAARATLQGPAEVAAAYHLDTRAENVMALAAYAAGAVLLAAPRLRAVVTAAVHAAGRRAGPDRLYREGLAGAEPHVRPAARHRGARPARPPRGRPGAPRGALVVAGILGTPIGGTYEAGDITAPSCRSC